MQVNRQRSCWWPSCVNEVHVTTVEPSQANQQHQRSLLCGSIFFRLGQVTCSSHHYHPCKYVCRACLMFFRHVIPSKHNHFCLHNYYDYLGGISDVGALQQANNRHTIRLNIASFTDDDDLHKQQRGDIRGNGISNDTAAATATTTITIVTQHHFLCLDALLLACLSHRLLAW